MIEEEIPKYKKKEESDTSKISKRSKHKHEYIGCFCHRTYHFVYSDINKTIDILAPHEVCKICGKVGKHLESCVKEGSAFRLLDDKELKEKYPSFVTVELDEKTDDKYIIENDVEKLK